MLIDGSPAGRADGADLAAQPAEARPAETVTPVEIRHGRRLPRACVAVIGKPLSPISFVCYFSSVR